MSSDKFYRYGPEGIPEYIREIVKLKLGPEANVYPPRNNSSYKGIVIHADADYIVQSVGRNQFSAIVHRREDIELKGGS